jgi:VWFA-related protein
MPSRWTIAVALALSALAVPAGQDRQTSEPPRFRVSIEVVRIDAVVTDRDGRVVPDLTAGDFQVFQDGKPQKVTFAQFVPVLAAQPSSTPPRPAAKDSPTPVPVVPAPPVKRENIQRTLVVVVDDLGLSVESLGYTKQALHAFVDHDLQPSDLVAVIRTGGTSDMLQAFTTDPRILHAAIDSLRWNGFSRSGVEAFEPLNRWLTFDTRHGMGDLDDFKRLNDARGQVIALGTLGALNMAIRGARDLPGRKAVIFASEGFKLLDDQGDTRMRLALDRAVDQAVRAGVLIYALDCRGLQSAALIAADNYKSGPIAEGAFEGLVAKQAGERLRTLRDTQESMAYLAEQTGGFAVLNTNALSRGFGRITDDIRDYYVIGYVPDEGTFAEPGKTPRYHKISVKVRRSGLRVRTRKEFLGVADPIDLPVIATPAHQLVQAAISPFAATEIPLRATTLPAYSPEDGVFVRALLHIDARGFAFSDANGGGKKTASADVLGMVFDQDGVEVAHLSTGFSVALTDQAAEDALRDGLAYSLRIPVPRPGGYQVRFALRDQQSGRLGSAGEFVEVPDVPGGAFALSGILLQAGEATQALRSFQAGASVTYSYEIYNAAKDVQVVTSIWRGMERVLAAPAERLTAPEGNDRRFAARGHLKLGDGLPAGNYVLQIAAATADPKREGALRTTIQRTGFDVRRDEPGAGK